MIRFLPAVLGLVVLLAFQPAPALAQGARTWEFGVDLGFNVAMTDNGADDLISVGVPGTDFGAFLQNLRVGYNATDTFGIETGLGFSYAKQGSDTLWRLGFSLDGMYNLPTESDTHWFLRAGGLVSVLGGSSDTLYQLGLGVGAGTRLILGSQWGLRFELGGSRLFENDDFYAGWNFTGSVGFSFFTM